MTPQELKSALTPKISRYVPVGRKPTPKQAVFMCLNVREAAFGGQVGGGKALSLECLVAIGYNRFETIENIQPGDYVLGLNGKKTKVLACSDIMHGQKCYRLKFDTGDTFIADAGHLWRVRQYLCDDVTISSEQLSESLERGYTLTVPPSYVHDKHKGKWISFQRRRIVDCVETISVPVKCIKVAAEDGMFLIGKNYIPTHNSDALLMDACQGLDYPGYAAILLRRSYSDLSKPGALMDRAHDWFSSTGARWVDKTKTWHFKTQGKYDATLSFGYMDTDKDRFQFSGSEYQYAGWDEVTGCTLRQYTFMFSRMRYTTTLKELMMNKSNGISLPLKVRSATNPGNVGHVWFKNRFIKKSMVKCAMHPTYDGISSFEGCKTCKEVFDSHNRIFVPSGLSDNPYLQSEEYVEMLGELDPITRAQYLEGNWDTIEGGGIFSREWFYAHTDGRNHILPYNQCLKIGFKRIVRFWDLAGTKPSGPNPDPDYTAGLLLGQTHEDEFYILDVRRIRDNPGGVEKFVRDTSQEDLKAFGDLYSVRIELEPGSSGKFVSKEFTQHVLSGYDVRAVKSSGSKYDRAKPAAASAYNGHMFMAFGGWNQDFLDELEMFSEDNDSGHDDMVDSLSGALKDLRKGSNSMTVGTYGEHQLSKKKRLDEESDDYDPDDPIAAKLNHPAYKAAMERGRMFGFKGGV